MKQMPTKSSTEDLGPLKEAISFLKDGIQNYLGEK